MSENEKSSIMPAWVDTDKIDLDRMHRHLTDPMNALIEKFNAGGKSSQDFEELVDATQQVFVQAAGICNEHEFGWSQTFATLITGRSFAIPVTPEFYHANATSMNDRGSILENPPDRRSSFKKRKKRSR